MLTLSPIQRPILRTVFRAMSHSTAPELDKLSCMTKAIIPALDGVRGIAVLMVLAVHLAVIGVVPAQFRILNYALWTGWSGVDLFFALSGFLITGQLLDTLGAPGYFKNFYMRRALRIFPLFYLALGFTAVLYPFLPAEIQGHYPTRTGWVSHMVYLQNWWMPWKEKTHDVMGHFWSLGVEEQFYLIWPACVLWLGRKRLPYACVAGVAIALGLRTWAVLAGHEDSGVVLMGTWARFDTLLVGALCAVIVRGRVSVQRYLPWIAAVCLAITAIIEIGAREYKHRGTYMQSFGYTVLAVGYGCVVLWAFYFSNRRNWWDRVLSWSPLRAAGKYSYGIYIWHLWVYVAGRALCGKAEWYGRSRIWSSLLALALPAVSIGVALASYHGFEKWFLRLKRRYEPGSAPSRQEATAGRVLARAAQADSP
uniref:Acyltransferase 3 n=1 Tax=Solibacter usitatus (strain Ellin6076) TaxID=234267 RepID=Q01VY6_SOLUE